jgi:hypothetical protein
LKTDRVGRGPRGFFAAENPNISPKSRIRSRIRDSRIPEAGRVRGRERRRLRHCREFVDGLCDRPLRALGEERTVVARGGTIIDSFRGLAARVYVSPPPR